MSNFVISYINQGNQSHTEIIHHDSTYTPESVAAAFAELHPLWKVIKCRYATAEEMAAQSVDLERAMGRSAVRIRCRNPRPRLRCLDGGRAPDPGAA